MPGKAATSDRELSAMERLLNLNRQAPAKAAQGADPEVRHLPLSALVPNPTQPRRSFDDHSMDELADSIRSRGLIQPLLVRPHPDESDRYEIVVGERRFVAAGRAGLETVPCVVRPLDDRDAFLLSVAENVAREDLNPMDEAAAYRRMLDEGHAKNQGEIAQLIGVHRSRVSRKLKLLQLDLRVQEAIRREPGVLSPTHLEDLCRLKAGDEQLSVFGAAVRNELSTRELHARVEALLAPRGGRTPSISKSVIPLQGGARVTVYPEKYMVRIPRQAGEAVDAAAIIAALERIVEELRARV